MTEPDPSLESVAQPGTGEEGALKKEGEDERTVSTMNSFADDASLNRRVKERLEFLSSGDTPKDLSEMNEQSSMWSGCTGCTGDDTLSLPHMCRAIAQEVECLYAGQRGKSVIKNGIALPYICWPKDDDSDFSSIAKDDSSESSGTPTAAQVAKDELTTEASGIKDSSCENVAESQKDTPTEEAELSMINSSLKVSSSASNDADSKAEEASTANSTGKLNKSIFFWRASSKDRIVTRSMPTTPLPIRSTQKDSNYLEDPELEQLVKDIIRPPSLERQTSIPETVNTSLGPSEHLKGIDIEDLSDDDSNHGEDTKNDNGEDSDTASKPDAAEERPSMQRDSDSTPSGDKSKRSGRAILGKMKRAFSKGSFAHRSIASRDSKPKDDVKSADITAPIDTSEPKDDADDAAELVTTGSEAERESDDSGSKDTNADKKGKTIDEPEPEEASATSDASPADEPETTSPSVNSNTNKAPSAALDHLETQTSLEEDKAAKDVGQSKPSALVRAMRSFGVKDRENEVAEVTEVKAKVVDTENKVEENNEDLFVSRQMDPGDTAHLDKAVPDTESASETVSDDGDEDAEPIEEPDSNTLKEQDDLILVESKLSEQPSIGMASSTSEDNLLNPIILDRVRRSFANAGLFQSNDEKSGGILNEVDQKNSSDKEENKESFQPELEAALVEKTDEADKAKGTESLETSPSSSSDASSSKSAADDDVITMNERTIEDSAARRSQPWYDDSGFLLCQCTSPMKKRVEGKALESLPETSVVEADDLNTNDRDPLILDSASSQGIVLRAGSEDEFSEQGILVKIRSSVEEGLLLRLFIDVEKDESKSEKAMEVKNDSDSTTEPTTLQDPSDVHCDTVSISGVSMSETTVVTNNTRVVSALLREAANEKAIQTVINAENSDEEKNIGEEMAEGREMTDEENIEMTNTPSEILQDLTVVPTASVLQRIKQSFGREHNSTNAEVEETVVTGDVRPDKDEENECADDSTKEKAPEDKVEQVETTKVGNKEADEEGKKQEKAVVLESTTVEEPKHASSTTISTEEPKTPPPSPARTDAKKQERIAKIKEMIENASDIDEDSDKDIIAHANADTASVVSSEIDSKPAASSSSTHKKKSISMPVGLPPSGRKASSKKKRTRLSKVKSSIRKLSKPKDGE